MTGAGELAFLGEEFLTWVWFRSETGQGTYRVAGGTEVGVVLDDFLAMDGQEDGTLQTLRNGLPSRTPEATIGLMGGKRLVRARIVLGCAGEEWTLTLDGPRFAFGTVRPSHDDPDEVEDGRDASRMQAFVRAADLVGGVYRIFLRERLRDEFLTETVPRMRRWVREREER